jgi:hypothetical protein
MRPISMKESIGKKSVPLLIVFNVPGIELQFIKQIISAESQKGNNTCERY